MKLGNFFMLVLISTTRWHQSSRGRSGSEMVNVIWYNLSQNSHSLVGMGHVR